MQIQDIKTIEEAVSYLKQQIAREEREQPGDIAWDITDLLASNHVTPLRQEFPKLAGIVDLSAELEVTDKAGYRPAWELWEEIKKLTIELEQEVAQKPHNQ